MKYSWVIWDFNGTLLDDCDLNMRVMDEMLLERGKPPMQGLEDYRRRFCFPVIKYYENVGWDFSEYTFKELAEDYVRRYKAGCSACGLFPDVLPAMDDLSENVIKQAVLYAIVIELLRRQLGELGILERLGAVAGVEDIYASGKAELGKRFIIKAGIDPNAAILIGDTEHDALVARELNCKCILVARGHQSREALESTGFPVLSDLASAAKALLCEDI